MDGPTMGNNRGKTVKSHKQISHLDTCTSLCDEDTKCKSLLYHSKQKVCTLKDKLLDGSEQIVKKNKIFFSVFKSCREGNHFYIYFCIQLLFCNLQLNNQIIPSSIY